MWLAQVAMCPFAAMLVRLSLLALYHRLFSDASRSTRHLIAASSVFMVLFYPALGFMTVGTCAPPPGDANYIKALQSWRCIRQHSSRYYLLSGFSIVSDVLLFVLPVRLVWGLQLPVQRKIAVSALFLVSLA
jgi:hypothetical protein